MLRDRFTRPLSTRARWLFAIAGAVLPILCLVLDPLVFRVSGTLPRSAGAMYGAYRAFGYVATVLACALLLHAVLSRTIPLIETGMLYGAAAISFVLGVLLFLWSFLGLFIHPIALLGFSPLLAAAAYLRFGGHHHVASRQRLFSRPALLGALLFLAIPAAVQFGVDSAMRSAVATTNVRLLHALKLLYDPDQLASRWNDEATPPAEKERLSAAYQELTGELVEWRMQQMLD